MAMNSRELMKSAMRREKTERIPTMPQICHDTPIYIYSARENSDWRECYKHCVEDPEAIYEYVLRLVKEVGCDGLRLFVPNAPMKVEGNGNNISVIDPKTDQQVGRLDLYGGSIVIQDKSVRIDSLYEAKTKLDEMVEAFTDEKLQALEAARAKVTQLFVASSPGGITMTTYSKLRGREQAMTDFYERPDFVSAVIDMQAEMAIRQAEKLLLTGIDAFYIGDPDASASLISPQHFERFCLPAYQKFCRHFENTDILIYIHICGKVGPILELMAETGVDTIEPLDPLGSVEVADAKKRVGERVALMGGVNTLTLSDGTAKDVHIESIRKCREGGPAGYILAAGDMVPPKTPLENLQAMVDVAKKSLWK